MRNTVLVMIGGLAAALLCALAPASGGRAGPTGNARVDRLLAQMTLAEKLAMLHGTTEPADTDQGEAGYLPGVPRLGIPPLRFADGPPGVLTRVPSLALTATMGVAATFSVEDARLNGEVIARQTRSHGADVALQPFININRDPAFGRGYNTFGEDPFLTGQIGAAEIAGIQANGVMAQAKHFIGYDNGGPGGDGNVFIDDQTMHELYGAPFQAAVDAGVASVMCAYNKVNGKTACGNAETLQGLLRRDFGFRGFVTSDWEAVHDALDFNAGVDLEMPGVTTNVSDRPIGYFAHGPRYLTEDPRSYPSIASQALPEEQVLNPAAPLVPKSRPVAARPPDLAALVAAGTVSLARVDEAVGRILVQMDRFGLLGRTGPAPVTPYDLTADRAIVQETSVHAAVLLKNEGDLLPLAPANLAQTVLIGPTARQIVPVATALEKAPGLVEHQVSPVDALRRLSGVPGIGLAVAADMDGTTIPAAALSHGEGGQVRPGLVRRMWEQPSVTVDPQVDFTAAGGRALPVNSSAVWSGYLTVPQDGLYDLNLQLLGARGRLILDDTVVIDQWYNYIHGLIIQPGQRNIVPTLAGLDSARARVRLASGRHRLRVEMDPDGSDRPAQLRLSWTTPAARQAEHDAAVAMARSARTAVVFAWSRSVEPVFALPGDQDRLISDIAAVNPNTVVVLNTSQPVAMPWLGRVKSVVQMWWGGDEGGWATARILLGKDSPGGRLPFTWPKRREDLPAVDPRHPERSFEGIGGKTQFSEGLFVGYRWLDREGIAPLFPFGHGLSYTSFAYRDLRVARARDGGLDLHLTIANTGKVPGDEVVQAYLEKPERPPAGVQFVDKALAGFVRVGLQPGQAKPVVVHVPPRQLRYWSTAQRRWALAAGRRTVWVGGSSSDRRLAAEITM